MKGIPLGFKSDGSFRVYRENGHLLTVAPPRSGKATDLLIPALLLCEHSFFVIDPRGQLAAVTARRRREMGQEVVLLNPFNEWPKYLRRFAHKTYNPCCVLDKNSPSFATDCDGLSEALVLPEAPGSHNKYFTDSARQLISGLIMYIGREFGAAEKNLVSLYDTVTVPKKLDAMVTAALKLNNALITGRLGRFMKSSDDQRKSIAEIVLSAITELGFVGNTAIRDSLQSAPNGVRELRFKDLRRRPMTVYLILPLEQIMPCAKWFRLVLQSAMFDLMHNFSKGGPGLPVLMMLDEFAQLGRLDIIEAAEAQAAGFGIQLWPVLQDYGQLKGIYDDRADSFVAGAAISTWYAPREMTTASYLSQHCGTKEVAYETKNINYDLNRMAKPGASPTYGISTGGGYERREVPLFRPDELMKLGDEKMIVLYKGEKILGDRRKCYRSDEFRGMYDPDPYHDKARPNDPIIPRATPPPASVPEDYDDEDFDEEDFDEDDEDDEPEPWSELEKRLARLVGYRRYQDPDEDELSRYHLRLTELAVDLAIELFELDTGASIFDVRKWEGLKSVVSLKDNEWVRHLDEIQEKLENAALDVLDAEVKAVPSLTMKERRELLLEFMRVLAARATPSKGWRYTRKG